MANVISALDIDPFSDESLTDPYANYQVLRDVGPVFSLPKYATVGIARFDHVQVALKDWRHFTSSEGPGFNDPFNSQLKDTVVALDPPDHKDVRSVMVKRLRLGRLREVAPLADQVAAELLDTLGDQKSFDAARDIARPFVTLPGTARHQRTLRHHPGIEEGRHAAGEHRLGHP